MQSGDHTGTVRVIRTVERVLPTTPVTDLRGYVERGGGRGLTAARAVDPATVIDLIDESGLRGRGGAGFPTGRKWRAVAERRSSVEPTTVVVNGAEGEPGCFKDRAILHANPYAVLEGALVAAHVVGANEVIVAMKESFEPTIDQVDRAIGEVELKGWLDGAKLSIVEGPSEYLFGEETALLEVVDGRAPFPRTAPPFRHGVDEVVPTPAEAAHGASSSPALVRMASPTPANPAPPTLANNVETLANVPAILVEGADWFRSVGTPESPGTVVCTVTGCTQRDGVGEVALGTPLRDVIDCVGGGPRPGRQLTALLSGVANSVVPARRFDTPLSYEAMDAIGSGLGAAGLIVFDDTTDFMGVAAGVARFLAVESCGQCRHCKQDGLELCDLLHRLSRTQGHPVDLGRVDTLLGQIDEGARCNLAGQQRIVVGSLLERYRDQADEHAHGRAEPVEPELVAPMVDIADGVASYDERQGKKQPDWTYDAQYSGKWPADRLAEHRGG